MRAENQAISILNKGRCKAKYGEISVFREPYLKRRGVRNYLYNSLLFKTREAVLLIAELNYLNPGSE